MLKSISHLAALSAKSGLKTLPFLIDNFLVDIYQHFKHTSKCCQDFADVLQDFKDIIPMKVLKHCTTQWLSLECAIKRLIELWPGLHAYFNHESEGSGARPNEHVTMLLLETQLYLTFVAFALRPLNSFNTAFQVNATKICVMRQSILDLLRGYLANFVKQDVLLAAEDITTVQQSDPNNQIGDNELEIGMATRFLLIKNEDELAGTQLVKSFFYCCPYFLSEDSGKNPQQISVPGSDTG